jgi:hypothetical protein
MTDKEKRSEEGTFLRELKRWKDIIPELMD